MHTRAPTDLAEEESIYATTKNVPFFTVRRLQIRWNTLGCSRIHQDMWVTLEYVRIRWSKQECDPVAASFNVMI